MHKIVADKNGGFRVKLTPEEVVAYEKLQEKSSIEKADRIAKEDKEKQGAAALKEKLKLSLGLSDEEIGLLSKL